MNEVLSVCFLPVDQITRNTCIVPMHHRIFMILSKDVSKTIKPDFSQYAFKPF